MAHLRSAAKLLDNEEYDTAGSDEDNTPTSTPRDMKRTGARAGAAASAAPNAASPPEDDGLMVAERLLLRVVKDNREYLDKLEEKNRKAVEDAERRHAEAMEHMLARLPPAAAAPPQAAAAAGGPPPPPPCLLYTSPSPRDKRQSRMPSSA